MAMGFPPLCHRTGADEGTNTPLMIAQAIVSICRFLRSLLHVFGVLWSAHPCAAARPVTVVNRSHVCAIDSESGLEIGLNDLARSGAHNDHPRRGLCDPLAKRPSLPAIMLPQWSMTARDLSPTRFSCPRLSQAIRDSPEMWLGIFLNLTHAPKTWTGCNELLDHLVSAREPFFYLHTPLTRAQPSSGGWPESKSRRKK
jgi:hypothetical protein